MFTVYVLSSLRNGRRYVGFTARDVEERLAEHNRGYPKGWTSRNGPFDLVYVEQHHTAGRLASITGWPRTRRRREGLHKHWP